MNDSICRPIPAAVLWVLLAGCQTGPAEGEYVTFVREVMAESARLKEASGDGPERSEQAQRAVAVWRGEEERREDD